MPLRSMAIRQSGQIIILMNMFRNYRDKDKDKDKNKFIYFKN